MLWFYENRKDDGIPQSSARASQIISSWVRWCPRCLRMLMWMCTWICTCDPVFVLACDRDDYAPDSPAAGGCGCCLCRACGCSLVSSTACKVVYWFFITLCVIIFTIYTDVIPCPVSSSLFMTLCIIYFTRNIITLFVYPFYTCWQDLYYKSKSLLFDFLWWGGFCRRIKTTINVRHAGAGV